MIDQKSSMNPDGCFSGSRILQGSINYGPITISENINLQMEDANFKNDDGRILHNDVKVSSLADESKINLADKIKSNSIKLKKTPVVDNNKITPNNILPGPNARERPLQTTTRQIQLKNLASEDISRSLWL